MPEISHHDDQRRVRVLLGERSYDIVVGQNQLLRLADFVQDWTNQKQPGRTAFIVTDEHVVDYANIVGESLRNGGWRVETHVFPAGEGSKCLEAVSAAWDQLVEMRADRGTVVIAVGGGVVGDAAGFIAATFARGLRFIQAPTTLLADVDSSVGGKVGINHPQAKNLIGAFHQPLGVVIDTQALATLPDREFRSGLAEVVKYGVIMDAPFFEELEQLVDKINARDDAALRDIIARCCELKARVVEEDEYERSGLRAILNYGHTFAHAFEALAGYGLLLHGEAVSIGMVMAAQLAQRLGRISQETVDRQNRLLERLHLPVALPDGVTITIADTLQRMQLDKKTARGTLRFILPDRIGHVELVDVPQDPVRDVLRAAGLPE